MNLAGLSGDARLSIRIRYGIRIISWEFMLDIQGITLIRDGKEILHEVSLSVGDENIHCIVGPNGSGKSSLAYTIMGCSGYFPSGGTIEFNGQDVTHLSLSQRAKAGITLAWQEPARFEGLSVKDYLAICCKGEVDYKGFARVLALVNLSPKRYLEREVGETLSGGERKRVELASIVMTRPKLAILDEPDSGIDVVSIQDIVTLIQVLKEEGAAVLVITHRPEIVNIGDSASLICDGRIVLSGSPSRVSEHYLERCRPCEVETVHRT
ncbi:MAG: ABC transporter ATP-binding protein [Methanosarcinales archaeon]|nr:ABC transporter ATP-binding protein [ANME-2 cluster archaeon]MDW7776652.1 ABC transporter ATP-binding protein [Methanosarcinales archaeon]